MATEFNISSFIARLVFAVGLVFSSYNPSGYSYISWVFEEATQFGPLVALLGLLLLIGWIIFLRATLMSLGWLGILLGGAVFACLV